MVLLSTRLTEVRAFSGERLHARGTPAPAASLAVSIPKPAPRGGCSGVCASPCSALLGNSPQPTCCCPACADFYYEFQQALKNSPLFPSNTKMLVLWYAIKAPVF